MNQPWRLHAVVFFFFLWQCWKMKFLGVKCLEVESDDDDRKFVTYHVSRDDLKKQWDPQLPLIFPQQSPRRGYSSRRKRINSRPATCTCTCETKVLKGSSNKHSFSDDRNIRNHDDHDSSAGIKQRFDESLSRNHVMPPNESHINFGLAGDQSNPENIDSIPDGSWDQANGIPWQSLPDTMCYRKYCTHDSDCCKQYNSCDKSAKVCTDCWRGVSCTTDSDCCFKFPRCQATPISGVGKCVEK